MKMKLYNLAIRTARLMLPIAGWINPKIDRFVKGRKNNYSNSILSGHTDSIIWMHAASLGEYEQGLPVIEGLKKKFPKYKILISFFSPSGYDVRHTRSIADEVVYLPWDTPKDIDLFLSVYRPKLALIVKYELWPNLLLGLKKKNINTYLISGRFYNNHFLFKHPSWHYILNAFTYFFVQDEKSKQLLENIGYFNVSVSGDTRFDRVSMSSSAPGFIEDFIQNRICIVAGSTWPEDEALLLKAIKSSNEKTCWIIAPHEIQENKIQALIKQIQKPLLRYSELKHKDVKHADVFILDTVGQLAATYAEADIAYIGGGVGSSGLHNILEPAAHGIPIIIGQNYHDFPEAVDLVKKGGVISVKSSKEFEKILINMVQHNTKREQIGSINQSYVADNRGATAHILKNIFII